MLRRRWFQYSSGLLALSLLAAIGCGGGPTALNNQLQAVLGATSLNPVTIRVVNQTGQQQDSFVKLDVLVDGSPLTLDCTVAKGVCDTVLSTCPQQVETVREQTLDAQGRFLGGWNFQTGAAAFTFTSPQVHCGAFIIYQITDTTINAFVL